MLVIQVIQTIPKIEKMFGFEIRVQIKQISTQIIMKNLIIKNGMVDLKN